MIPGGVSDPSLAFFHLIDKGDTLMVGIKHSSSSSEDLPGLLQHGYPSECDSCFCLKGFIRRGGGPTNLACNHAVTMLPRSDLPQ